ncbi:hydrogenase maturation protease [Pontibacter anaerobius]|uniref:Hydrogenase maturation protease n=1 Tax=Pontibacter anaerobius TaxID=2993940 RepID=A0ABT3RDW0_9BACT|nr:hydrogenase maturation protease [Pontibacter anaerobius]MCX2739725.1 hydrogenase maturation protease [Pontibacter anaerobius]
MNAQEVKRSLLVGIGNSAREDDGLGWAFVERVEQEGLFKGDCLYRFQLNLEDAELVTKYKRVLFVDAHKGELPNGYSFRKCMPDAGADFSTHQLSPESIVYLSQQLYNVRPQAFILGIQGYKWGLKEGLSEQAQENLEKALKGFLQKRNGSNLILY